MPCPYSMTESGVTLATGAPYRPAHGLTQLIFGFAPRIVGLIVMLFSLWLI